MSRSSSLHRSQRGMSLVESCVVLAIATIVVGVVAPSFEQMRERRHIEGTAAQLETDLQYARSLAVARNQTLRFSFAGPACYVVHTGAAGDCACTSSGTASCTGSAEALRVAAVTAVALASNSATLSFDPAKGTVTPTATMRVVGHSGASVRNIINVMGRVRSCSPAPALPGYVAC